MHHTQRVEARGNIVQHNSGAFGNRLQLSHRRRLDDIKGTKKYKARQKTTAMQAAQRSERPIGPPPRRSPRTEDLLSRSPAPLGCRRQCRPASPPSPERPQWAFGREAGERGPTPPTAAPSPPTPRSPAQAAAVRCRKTWRSAWPTVWSPAGCQPSRFFVRIFGRALADLLVCIRNRRRNHIGAACPLAQIDGAAAVTAEGKFGVAALHNFLADRAAEFERCAAWYGVISGSC